jgi:coenzyme F420-reducing hydrogenase alpha subunit
LKYGPQVRQQIKNDEKLVKQIDDLEQESKKVADEAGGKSSTHNIAKKFGEITKEIMKKEIPKDFLNALKKFGRTEDEILEYYTKYHNENNFIFFKSD